MVSPEKEYGQMFDLGRLESIGRDGFETYKGPRSLEFRVGIEQEFQIVEKDPPTVKPEERATLIEEFRDHAHGFIDRLEPANDIEQATKERWQTQIDEFGVQELLNFLVYEEFSIPQLDIPSVPKEPTVEDIDQFTEQNGWVEWRFGTGALQSGYFDNPGVSELRTTPVAPEEAVHRMKIINERIQELGDELGVDVRSSVGGQHVTMSAFEVGQAGKSIFGNDAERQADTLDVMAGFAQLQNDGITVEPAIVQKYKHVFSKHHTEKKEVGPSRKAVRIMDGRIEFRGGFQDTAQAVSWLVGGAEYGLAHGKEAIENNGVETPQINSVQNVRRQPNFDKNRDLQLQRAFENAKLDDEGRFALPESGWALMKGSLFAEQLGFDIANYNNYKNDSEAIRAGKLDAWDTFTRAVVYAAQVDTEGRVRVTPDSLAGALEYIRNPNARLGLERREKSIDNIKQLGFNNLESLAQKVNERLDVIRIGFNDVITGDIKRQGKEFTETLEEMRGSEALQLVFGEHMEDVLGMLENAREINIAMEKTKEEAKKKQKLGEVALV